MYDFWYDYINPKYEERAKMCYTNNGRFFIHIKTENIYKDIAEDFEWRFDISNYEVDRPLPIVKNKLLEIMKEKFCWITTKNL